MQHFAVSLWKDAKALANEEEPCLVYLPSIRGIFICSPSKDSVSRLIQLVLGHEEPLHECPSARCSYGAVFEMTTWKQMKQFAASIDDNWGLGRKGRDTVIEPSDLLPLSTIAYFREVILNGRRISQQSCDIGWEYKNFLHPLPSAKQLAGEAWLTHWQEKQGIHRPPVAMPPRVQIVSRTPSVGVTPTLTGRARRKAIQDQRIKAIRDRKTEEELFEEASKSFARANSGLQIPTERIVGSYSGRESERRLRRIGE